MRHFYGFVGLPNNWVDDNDVFVTDRFFEDKDYVDYYFDDFFEMDKIFGHEQSSFGTRGLPVGHPNRTSRSFDSYNKKYGPAIVRVIKKDDLTENIHRLQELMGLIVEDVITEHVVNDWLIDWFNKVPQSKLSETFTTIDKNGKEKSLSRLEIQLLLSDKSKVIVVTDPKEIELLDGRIAFFLENKVDSYPEYDKYVGKVVINGDWLKLVKDPQYANISKIEDLKHHEQIHLLQHSQQDKDGGWAASGAKIISNHCKGNPLPQCDEGFGYFRRPEEIYAHLFSMRELLGIQPMDTVTDASVVFQGKNAIISVTVDRNGKIGKLPTKTIDRKYNPFVAIYCCNKSFKESLTYLHNTLAGVQDQSPSVA